MSEKTKAFAPEIFDEEGGVIYAAMLLKLSRCATCAVPMMRRVNPHYDSMFPNYFLVDQVTQLSRAGWQLQSDALDRNDRPICVACKAADKASFICCFCQSVRQSSQLKTSVGDPPDYLCVPCYESVPASKWDAKKLELEVAHQYDHC